MRYVNCLLGLAASAVLTAATPAAHAQKVLKYAHFQPAKDDQPKHVAALAFKEHVEKATNGSLKVEIYPAGQFGKDQQTMEGVKLGTLELAVAHDGAIATVQQADRRARHSVPLREPRACLARGRLEVEGRVLRRHGQEDRHPHARRRRQRRAALHQQPEADPARPPT